MFGSNYIKYDEQPKKYAKQSIMETLAKIDMIKVDLGGTDIYNPIKDIFNFYQRFKWKKLLH